MNKKSLPVEESIKLQPWLDGWMAYMKGIDPESYIHLLQYKTKIENKEVASTED
ncbi:hypothetical protein [Heliorestis acidaminivorans]|uniref:hypothetical protein n=1 Tax=Heliorestis acidaminivorans TaxID=553427 RepID=UPI00147851F5|nr:hypothetical protein [Heliorestis acidaminivorans]